jgi:hypothetical protein
MTETMTWQVIDFTTSMTDSALMIDNLLLRRALLANGVFSLVCGAAMAGVSAVSEALGPPPGVVGAVGAALMVGSLVLLAASTAPSPLVLGRAALIADIAWVVGTVVILAMGVFSPVGVVAALSTATVVAMFALLEWKATRR